MHKESNYAPYTPKSVISGIHWPALPSASGAVAMAIQFQLERSQWLSAKQLQTLQLEQLQRLLQHAHAHNLFYKTRLDAAGIHPGSPLTMDVFRKLPLLGRADIQRLGSELCSDQTPKDHGRPLRGKSSGSTGRPIESLGNELCQLFWRAVTLREHLWHRRDFSGKLAVIRAGAKSAENPGWGPSTDAVFETGPSASLDIETDLATQATWLQAQDPAYLLAYPSNLLGLAQLYRTGTFRLTRLKGLRSFGETLTAPARQFCEDAFQVPVVDMYSATEVGYIALQCPESGHYHVQSETILAEVLRDDGSPCEAGEIGRIVLTPLHNFSMPLIRYDIGDHVRLGSTCACGRGLTVLEQVLGRSRNLLTLPDGRQFWPYLHMMDWPKIAPVVQAQAIQTSLHEIDIRLVLTRQMQDNEQARLSAFIQEKLPHPFVLKFSFHDAIAKSASGKYEDFISQVSLDPARVL
ncbi:phenylacetate--CoA ligase family protein [Rhodoferax sp. 4810]|nr:phenylacetate--CoA ligase family protein [Rhodoferax jenense]